MLGLWKRLPPGAKHRVATAWYGALSHFDRTGALDVLNHGYAATDGPADFIDLPAHLEQHRYGLQMYHRAAALADWTEKDAVEISCGPGGGASYVFERFRPRSMIGIDLAAGSVHVAHRTHARAGLTFIVGDAQALPLPARCCDIVLNVASSSNYLDQRRFFAEVDRILRPRGVLLFCDFRTAAGLRMLATQFDALGYIERARADVSRQVALALRLDEARKQARIRDGIPFGLRRTAGAFMHAGGAALEEARRFEGGQKIMVLAALEKPA